LTSGFSSIKLRSLSVHRAGGRTNRKGERAVKKALAVLCAAVIGAVAFAGSAFAGAGGTKGPGDCGFAPGQDISAVAKDPGPNAGPNGAVWFVATGDPNAPGQAVQNVCNPGG
jgi:hypothetical protein